MNSFSPSPRAVRLLWLVPAVLAGAAVGWLVKPPPMRVENRPGVAAFNSPNESIAKPAALARRLEALNAGTPAQQLNAALQLAEVESVEDIRVLLDRSHAFPRNAAGGLAVNVLLRRWLELDAGGALNYADLRQSSHWDGLVAVYAALYPAEAEAYWRTFPSGEAKANAWEGLCDGLILRHPAEAWRLLLGSDSNTEKMVRKLAARDVEDTLVRFNTIPSGWQSAARKVIAAELMKKDPARALAWIANQPEQRELIAEAAAVTYRKDPGKAFALLAGLSERDRNIALSNMTAGKPYRWGYSGLDLHQAGTGRDWSALAGAVMNSPLNEEDRTSLLNHFFWQDPGRGQAFWGHFTEKAQIGKLPAYLYRWSALDKASAEAWWRGLPPGPVRAAAETHWQELEAAWHKQGESEAGRLRMAIWSADYPHQTDSRLADLTPGEVSTLVSAIPKPDYGRIAAMINGVGASNPDVVATWLETAPVTNETLPVMAEFSARWALDDPGAAAAWVSRLPEGKLADTAAFNIARQYQVYDPEGSQQWMEGLVEKTVQEAARKGLLADREMDSE
jgi:hypothetical protein